MGAFTCIQNTCSYVSSIQNYYCSCTFSCAASYRYMLLVIAVYILTQTVKKVIYTCMTLWYIFLLRFVCTPQPMNIRYYYTHCEVTGGTNTHTLELKFKSIIPRHPPSFECYSVEHVLHMCMCSQEHIMKEGKGRGEGARSTHALIEISRLTHAAHVTKNSKTARYVAKKHLVNAMFVTHSSFVRHNREFKNCCTNEWSDRITLQKSASQKTALFIWQTGQS